MAVTVTEGDSQLVCLVPVMTDVLDAEFTVQLSLQGGTATGGMYKTRSPELEISPYSGNSRSLS